MTKELSAHWNQVMLGNYGTPNILISSASGSYVTASDGKQYLDLLSGIAVSALGHSHPRILQAINQQSAKFLHTSNLYAHQPGLDLAKKLLELADSSGRVLFTQDGATANEAALKLARLYGYKNFGDSKTKIVAMNGGFHGRTFGALAVTGNPAKREPFAPFGLDVEFIDIGDFAALQNAVNESVVAVIVEPIAGEGGIIVPPAGWLQEIRTLTQQHQALMIVDEVQSGIGRAGEWFLANADGIEADLITLAKGLAGGMPLGALIVQPNLLNVFQPGDHGTTFGGNPVSCAAALAVIQEIEEKNLLSHVRETGDWLQAELLSLGIPQITEVRGRGLWMAIEFSSDVAAVFAGKAQNAGFLVNAVKPNAIRLAPPLNISKSELETFLAAFPQIFQEAVYV